MASERRRRQTREAAEAVLDDKIAAGAYGKVKVIYYLQNGVVDLTEIKDTTRIK